MEPIRSRTPRPARERVAGSQADATKPSADQGASTPASSPLDGLPPRRTVSRPQRLPSPASLLALSEDSLSDLSHQVDRLACETAPSFSTAHAEAAPDALDEVQSALRAANDPQHLIGVVVTAAPSQAAAQTSGASPAAHEDLSTLGYSQPQQDKINPQVRSTVAQHHHALIGHGFTHAHIVELSKHPPALGTVAIKYPDIIAALPEATHEDIVGVGKQWSGARALEALLKVTAALREPPLQLVTSQLLKIAKRGGVTAVHAVYISRHVLTAPPLNLTQAQVVAIASNGGSQQALNAVQRLLPVLCEDHGLSPNQVVAIASNIGGKQALLTVQRLLPVLRKDHRLSANQVVAIASNIGGKQALEAVHRLLPVLCKDHGLRPDQVVAIASNGGGKQALEAVQRLLPVLCKDHGLTRNQVVTIASNSGGKQILETVQRLLPVLCEEHGLSPEQVVAIANNGGGRQALETVQRLLPVLCREHGLTLEQVVAIGSYDGGKQALEAVQRLLPVLCDEHGLTQNQVVAIASNCGGRQALEAVHRLLPGLCKNHGLTPDQVVAIASNKGSKQALESLFAQLSRPDPALAALSSDRLAVLACLGGRPALEAVIKGLPHTPLFIKRANRHIPERTSRRAANAAQVVQVLSFFQCHSHPERAFDEAMQQFGMSRRELLKFLRRVGVTELEACNGTLPPTSQRWQRILQASGVQPASAPTPTPSQESWHAFADALERDLDAPSPMHEADQVFAGTSRKRSRSDDSFDCSPKQPAEARVRGQHHALDADLPSGWSRKRPRTKIGGGLPDPGTPTGADLAASNTVFVGQDAPPLAGAGDDFPAFNDEEMAWLMTLLP